MYVTDCLKDLYFSCVSSESLGLFFYSTVKKSYRQCNVTLRNVLIPKYSKHIWFKVLQFPLHVYICCKINHDDTVYVTILMQAIDITLYNKMM